MEFERFYVVMLNDGTANAEQLAGKDIQLISRGHLDFQSRLHYEYGAVAGPLSGNRGTTQGMTLIPARDMTYDQVVELVKNDPAVKADLLSVHILEWNTLKGLVQLNQVEKEE